MKEPVFKIMAGSGRFKLNPIPLRILIPHEKQALTNHGGQSLLQLDMRGGLDPKEALHVLHNLRWDQSAESRRIFRLTIEEADRELRLLVRDRYMAILEEEERTKIHKACTHPERPVDISHGVEKCKKCDGWVAIADANRVV